MARVEPGPNRFGEALRHWRQRRRLTQLALALDAEVSARHLSFLESGRAKPSREMVLLLASVLDVPLRERNMLLDAAGFAPIYRETDLGSGELSEVRAALDFILTRQEPNPAIVMDRYSNVILANDSSRRLMGHFIKNPSAVVVDGRLNALRTVFHPEGLRPSIVNWDAVARALLVRFEREIGFYGHDTKATDLLRELRSLPGYSGSTVPELTSPPPPLLPLELRHGEASLKFLTTIATFGTPLDVTVQELRIESYFAANAEAERFLRDR